MGRQSKIGDKPVFKSEDFPFTELLEANWEKVRAELDAVLEQRDHLPPFHMVSQDQKKISFDDRWKTFILYGFGYKSERNCRQCPETTRLLEQVPNLRSAFFSILSPGYHIPSHRGVTKGVVRCHLGLKVPEDYENCVIRLEDETYPWRAGKCLVFRRYLRA